MVRKLMPSEASRIKDQVARLDSTSTSPVCSAVKRCCADKGWYLTLLASPSTAAAMTRHMSTSKPVHLPSLSGIDQPATPVDTPHTSAPFLRIASTVGPAVATAANPAPTAAVSATAASPRPTRVSMRDLLVDSLVTPLFGAPPANGSARNPGERAKSRRPATVAA